MHSKLKGNLGEISVAKYLINHQWQVFTELGDLSKVDLIGIKNNLRIFFQVKYITANKTNSLLVASKKSGPNYRFSYNSTDFDILAAYCPDVDSIAFISSKELCLMSAGLTLRLDKPLNNQNTKVKMFKDYTLEAALKDYTSDTIAATALENEIVKNRCGYSKLTTRKRRAETVRPTKIEWPTIAELQHNLTLMSFEELGRQLGVSGNAIRKRLKTKSQNEVQ
jgi:hypothetical protein